MALFVLRFINERSIVAPKIYHLITMNQFYSAVLRPRKEEIMHYKDDLADKCCK